MKINKLSAIAIAVTAFFASCSSDDKPTGVTNLTLDKTEASIKIGETVKLTATVTPGGAAEVKWESTKPEVASVSNDGTITGIAEGTTMIAATAGSKTASCLITVTKESAGGDNDPELHESLRGSEYFIIQIDGASADKIESKIVADFRPDEDTKFLYIWEGTYTKGNTTGLNFYGEAEEWVSLAVANVGWSGFGYNIKALDELNKLAVIMDKPEDYYFHIAMKSTDQASHLIGIDGLAGKASICIGSTPFEDAGVIHQPYKNITRNGEWNEVEVPMTYFIDQGLIFGANNEKDKNVFWGLSGAVAGTTLQFDACFIYKK